ncbi:hypothetical protein [Streptomyces lydicus]|uniref:hypothetical protein n=1 Tax=Streptomyces lydicus TaxID=47763 RepID=UPI00378A24FD
MDDVVSILRSKRRGFVMKVKCHIHDVVPRGAHRDRMGFHANAVMLNNALGPSRWRQIRIGIVQDLASTGCPLSLWMAYLP